MQSGVSWSHRSHAPRRPWKRGNGRRAGGRDAMPALRRDAMPTLIPPNPPRNPPKSPSCLPAVPPSDPPSNPERFLRIPQDFLCSCCSRSSSCVCVCCLCRFPGLRLQPDVSVDLRSRSAPRVREDPLGSRRSEILNASNNDYWVSPPKRTR